MCLAELSVLKVAFGIEKLKRNAMAPFCGIGRVVMHIFWSKFGNTICERQFQKGTVKLLTTKQR